MQRIKTFLGGLKGRLVTLSALLFTAHLLLESAELAQRFWPQLGAVYVQPFLKPGYVWPHDPAGIPLLWWIKYNTDYLLLVIVFSVLAKVAYWYNYRLFLVAAVFLFYHLLDYFMLWWDYNQTHSVYWVSLLLIIFAILVIVKPVKNKPAIIKQMKK